MGPVSDHRAAKRLAGEWIAHNYQKDNPRSIDPQTMPGAGLTVISAKSWWQTHSHVLDVHAQDLGLPELGSQIRNHHGWIAIDPGRPQRATRTIFYEDSDEIEEQRILISDDGNTLHVFDESADGGYNKKHALRRRMILTGEPKSPTSFILNFMPPEPVDGNGAAPPETKQGVTVLSARQSYALAFFVVCCIWLVVVAALLFLSSLLVAHLSTAVLIAAITSVPALFLIFRFLFPDAPPRPRVIYVERVERVPKTNPPTYDLRIV